MSILLFFLILIVLVIVHELGHFAVAKYFGIRVDEFGFGFPPKLWGKKIGETEYTFNALPFGGFVRIFGEAPHEGELDDTSRARSFIHKPKSVQALVLIAGIVCNILLAWVLLSAGYMIGMPVSTDYRGFGTVENVRTTIASVVKDSPAALAGLQANDGITGMSVAETPSSGLSPESIQTFIKAHQNDELLIAYTRSGTDGEVRLRPQTGIVEGKAVVGIEMQESGIAVMPPYLAPLEGARLTWNATGAIAKGLSSFFVKIFTGNANFSEVTGPVGLVGIVGDAASFGIVSLLSLIAFISINLAVINLIPFPALDGGRLLFVAIEALKGSPLRPEITNVANMAGFALLILLMLLVTYHDILRLFI